MSQHIFTADHRQHGRVLVRTGWDRRLRYHFLVVHGAEDDIVFSNLQLGRRRIGMTLLDIADTLRGLDLPWPTDLMERLWIDQVENVGNADTDHGHVPPGQGELPEPTVVLLLPDGLRFEVPPAGPLGSPELLAQVGALIAAPPVDLAARLFDRGGTHAPVHASVRVLESHLLNADGPHARHPAYVADAFEPGPLNEFAMFELGWSGDRPLRGRVVIVANLPGTDGRP